MQPRIVDVGVFLDYLMIYINDGRKLGIPLSVYPKLNNASGKLRASWRLIGNGDGVQWPELDVDLSLKGMLTYDMLISYPLDKTQ